MDTNVCGEVLMWPSMHTGIIVIYNVIMTNMSVIILYIVNPAYMPCEIMLFTLYYAKCGVSID